MKVSFTQIVIKPLTDDRIEVMLFNDYTIVKSWTVQLHRGEAQVELPGFAGTWEKTL